MHPHKHTCRAAPAIICLLWPAQRTSSSRQYSSISLCWASCHGVANWCTHIFQKISSSPMQYISACYYMRIRVCMYAHRGMCYSYSWNSCGLHHGPACCWHCISLTNPTLSSSLSAAALLLGSHCQLLLLRCVVRLWLCRGHGHYRLV